MNRNPLHHPFGGPRKVDFCDSGLWFGPMKASVTVEVTIMQSSKRFMRTWLAMLALSAGTLRAEDIPFATVAMVGDEAFLATHGAEAGAVLDEVFASVQELFRVENGMQLTLHTRILLSDDPWTVTPDLNGDVPVNDLLQAFRDYRLTEPAVTGAACAVLVSGLDFQGSIVNFTYVSGAGTPNGVGIVQDFPSFLMRRSLVARSLAQQHGAVNEGGSQSTFPGHPDPPACNPALVPPIYIMAASTSINDPPTTFSTCSREAVNNFASYAATNPAYRGMGITSAPPVVAPAFDGYPEVSVALVADAPFTAAHGAGVDTLMRDAFGTAADLYRDENAVVLTLASTRVLNSNPWTLTPDTNGAVSASDLLPAFNQYVNDDPAFSNIAAVLLFSGEVFNDAPVGLVYIAGAGSTSRTGIFRTPVAAEIEPFLVARYLGNLLGYRYDGQSTLWTGHPNPPPCDPATMPSGFIMDAAPSLAALPSSFSSCSRAAISNFAWAVMTNPAYRGFGVALAEPVITNLVRDAGVLYLSLPANLDRVYELQAGLAADTGFATVKTVTNTAGYRVILSTPEIEATQRFFRARARLIPAAP